MKILVFIIFGLVLYIILDKFAFKNKKYQKLRKWIAPAVIIFTSTLFITGAILTSVQGDVQCTRTHQVSISPPATLTSAQDYFESGNYNYDRGDCNKAIMDYSMALKLNSQFAESFNNRGYTYMRMRDYQNALSDLNMAIDIRPNYVNALMNRGDIYNYYLNNKIKAIQDYNKVLTIDPSVANNSSVCGHLLLAVNNGWHISTFFNILKEFPPTTCAPAKI